MILNHQNPKFQNRDVRWALALAIDIKAVVDGVLSRRGDDLGDRHPADRNHPEYYHNPLKEWLTAFEVDTGKRKIRPYDTTIGEQIADMLRPVHGRPDPDDPAEIVGLVRPAGGSRTPRRRPSSCSGPASPGAATTGTCPTASASPSSSWSRATHAR